MSDYSEDALVEQRAIAAGGTARTVTCIKPRQ